MEEKLVTCDLVNGKRIAFDCEVFQNDWLFIFIDVDRYNSPDYDPEKDVVKIWNNRSALERYRKEHEKDVFIGYNSRGYDLHILRAILRGLNPKEMSEWIIVEGKNGYDFEEAKYPGKHFGSNIHIDTFDISSYMGFRSLKELEGFMGNSIVESAIPFDLPRKLTKEEREETEFYCRHDVEQTIEAFNRSINEFDAMKDLVLQFFPDHQNYISKTKAQLTALILKCNGKIAEKRKLAKGKDSEWNDEWDLQFADTIRLNKYQYIYDWFKDPKNHTLSAELETEICGVPHQIGWGGLHGAPSEAIKREGIIRHVDVNSYYPSLMIQYGLLTRNSPDPVPGSNGKRMIDHTKIGTPLGEENEYVKVYKKRLQLKREGKKKAQQPYKICLNSTYGICNDVHSIAYDPRQAHSICMNGQLLLIDLLEHLEPYCEIIQSNTDGIILWCENEEKLEKVGEVCKEWEDRTRVGLAQDIITEIVQKDVNSYIFRNEDGSYERKGAYLKELSELDYDLPIVNEAMVKYVMEGIPYEDTINKCDELIKFQKIVKISSKYAYGRHNGEILNDKTFRVYASKNKYDTSLFKIKLKEVEADQQEKLWDKSEEASEKVEKFANTPDHCFIWNESVIGVKVPDNLDKKWYIDLTRDRLIQFGAIEKKVKPTITVKQFSLF